MKKLTMYFVIAILTINFSYVFSAPNFEIIYNTADRRMNDAAIVELVNNFLTIENNNENYSEVDISIYSKCFGSNYYFVVELFKSNQWGVASYKLNIEDNQIKSVEPDYVEEDPIDENFCASCPDPEVQVILGLSVSEAPQTVQPAQKKVEEALRKANIKFKSLVDSEESKTSVLNYLSCPKLVLYGRIGHGMPSSIKLGKKGSWTNITANDVSSEPFKSVITGKVFPFNSCYVGGMQATFGRSLVKSGGKWMCGGDDVELGMGSSEPTWTKFMQDICNNEEVGATFNKQMKNAKDKWRAQSNGNGPIYPFKQQK